MSRPLIDVLRRAETALALAASYRAITGNDGARIQGALEACRDALTEHDTRSTATPELVIERLTATLKGVYDWINQPVQHTIEQGPSVGNILRGDCAAARRLIKAVLPDWQSLTDQEKKS